MLNHLSLFSGYEGFGLGLRLAGLPIRTVGYLEIDDYCQRVLQVRMADGVLDHAPIIRDITACDFRPMAGLVDIITAGFPCQPHSVAGARLGADDERNLWPDTLRVIGEIRPAFAILENVPGLMSPTNSNRPLSGWADRWRRHHQYLGQTRQAILSHYSDWDEREGTDTPTGIVGDIWGLDQALSPGDYCMECWMDLVYLWGRSQSGTAEDTFQPPPEEAPCDSGVASVRSFGQPEDTDEDTSAMDDRSSPSCCCPCHLDEGIESEGADRDFGDGGGSSTAGSEQYLGYASTRFLGYTSQINAALAEIGYDCRWAIVSAAKVGAPHRRNRWWCLAERAGVCTDADGEQPAQPVQRPSPQESGGFGAGWGAAMADAAGQRRVKGRQPNQRQPPRGSETLADANSPRCQGCRHGAVPMGSPHAGPVYSGTAAMADTNCRRRGERPNDHDRGNETRQSAPVGGGSERSREELADADCPRCERGCADGIRQAQPEPGSISELADAASLPDWWGGQPRTDAGGVPWWQVEPALGRVVDGCPDRVASIRALGNGIVPAVVARFLRMIAP